MEAIETAFTGALDTVKTDTMGMLAKAAPAALAIAGVVIAVTLGVKFFKKMAH